MHHHRRDDSLFNAEGSLASVAGVMIDEEECLKEEKDSSNGLSRVLAEGKQVVQTEKRKLRRTRKSKLKKKNAERTLEHPGKGR